LGIAKQQRKPDEFGAYKASEWLQWTAVVKQWFAEQMHSLTMGRSTDDQHEAFFNQLKFPANPEEPSFLEFKNHLQSFPELFVLLKDEAFAAFAALTAEEKLQLQKAFQARQNDALRLCVRAEIENGTENAPRKVPAIPNINHSGPSNGQISGLAKLDAFLAPFVVPVRSHFCSVTPELAKRPSRFKLPAIWASPSRCFSRPPRCSWKSFTGCSDAPASKQRKMASR
jgi:hypothetical protein